MKLKFVLSGLMCLTFVLFVGSSVASAQSWGGTWVLDRSRSTDIPPGTEVTMTIVQKGSTLVVTQKFASSGESDVFKDTYVLNGKTQEVPLIGPNKTKAMGRRNSKKTDDGFESVDEGTFSPENMPQANVRTVRRWQLSQDGKTILLYISRTTNNRTQESRRLFVKR